MAKRKDRPKYIFLNGNYNIKQAIFNTIFYGVFLVLGVSALIFAFVNHDYSESLWAGLLFLFGGGLMFNFFAVYHLKCIIKQKSVIKSGKIATATISDYSCKLAKMRPGQETPRVIYHTVKFNYKFKNSDGKEITRKYKDLFSYNPCFGDGKTIPVLYNKRYALLLRTFGETE